MAPRRSRSQRLDRRVFYLANQVILGIMIEDLTTYKGDAIVNAANERMLGGGGVDGAIHRAAGRGLLEACRKVPEVSPGVRCPTGEARITPAFELPSKFVIHTVGPIYSSAKESAPLLEAAFRSSLELASEKQLSSVAFPAISCGVYGYPLPEAAHVAVKTCLDFTQQQGEGPVQRIDFLLFSPDVYEAWVVAAEQLSHGPVREEGEAGTEAKKPATDATAVVAENGGANKAQVEEGCSPMDGVSTGKDEDEAQGDKADPSAAVDKMEEQTCQATEATNAETTAKPADEGEKAPDEKEEGSAPPRPQGVSMAIASTEAVGEAEKDEAK